MTPLPDIKEACAKALSGARGEPGWHERYCKVVDPLSVLEMVTIIESLVAHMDESGDLAIVQNIRVRTGLPVIGLDE